MEPGWAQRQPQLPPDQTVLPTALLGNVASSCLILLCAPMFTLIPSSSPFTLSSRPSSPQDSAALALMGATTADCPGLLWLPAHETNCFLQSYTEVVTPFGTCLCLRLAQSFLCVLPQGCVPRLQEYSNNKSGGKEISLVGQKASTEGNTACACLGAESWSPDMAMRRESTPQFVFKIQPG